MNSLPDNVFDYIKTQEAEFGTDIEVMENWNWNFKDHVRNSTLMKYGKFIKGSNELASKNPKKNLVYANLNLRYRAEDVDLKNVTLYTEDSNKYHLSFLIKKYHDEKYIVEHDLDTFFDETKEEKIDLGATIARKGPTGPVHEPLDSIAFCDKTDLKSGPLCFKSFYSPDELLDMEKIGWGSPANGADVSLEELVTLAEMSKQQDSTKGRKTNTPGKYIEVYRLHGSLPSRWLPGATDKDKKFVRQIRIVAYYNTKDGKMQGVNLYAKKEYENPFKIHLSGHKIRNRALAFGGVEELMDPQIWTDYSEIKKRDILDAISKVIYITDDQSFTNKNKVRDADNGQVFTKTSGTTFEMLQSSAPNVQFLNQWMQELEMHAQSISGATDALQGKTPNAGTPFKLEALVTDNGMGLHEYRRGKFASWIAEIYRDWIIPDIAKELTNGTKFLAELSSDELEYVTNCMVTYETNKFKVKTILETPLGQFIDPAVFDSYEQLVREEFQKKGNKHFIEVLKGELEGIEFKVKVDVAGKQKDLQALADRFSNLLRFVFSTYDPNTKTFGALEDPKAVKAFNKLLEYSGMDALDFGYLPAKSQPQMMPSPMQPAPQAAPQPYAQS